MLHLFKIKSARFAYDSVSGKCVKLSSLAWKMADMLSSPLTEDCPSAVRYELAKYAGSDVTKAYAELYTAFSGGLLFLPDPEGQDTVCGGCFAHTFCEKAGQSPDAGCDSRRAAFEEILAQSALSD